MSADDDATVTLIPLQAWERMVTLARQHTELAGMAHLTIAERTRGMAAFAYELARQVLATEGKRGQ